MRKILFTLAALLLCANSAQASTYIWKDKEYGFTMSFPDTWTLQTPETPSTRVRVAGPVGEDLAACKIEVQKDGRLKIYPKRLMMTGITQTLDRAFWEGKIGEHEGAIITAFDAPASMGGQGDATAIRESYIWETGSGKVVMNGARLGSIYGDMLYIVSCSARADAYEKYVDVFASIAGSMTLDSRYHPYEVGYYRNFLRDRKIYIPREKPGESYAE